LDFETASDPAFDALIAALLEEVEMERDVDNDFELEVD